MRTSPSTVFTQNEYKVTGAECHWVLKLTDGTSTWYFGTTMMQLSEGYVYPLLYPSFTITQQIDFFSKRWSISNLSLRLRNTNFKKDATTSDFVRLSDVLEDVPGNLATLYCFTGSGSRVTQLSDGLAYYYGKVTDGISYDMDDISISIADKWTGSHKKLPSDFVGDVWASAPTDTITKRIPLVYGEYTCIGGDEVLFDRTGLGLTRGYRISYDSLHSAVISSHDLLTATGRFYYDVGMMHPGISDYIPTSSTVSGCELLTLDADNFGMSVYVQIVDNDDTGFTATSSLARPANASNFWDSSISTYATISSTIDAATFGIEAWPSHCYAAILHIKVSTNTETDKTIQTHIVDIAGDSIVDGPNSDTVTNVAGWETTTFSAASGTPTGLYILCVEGDFILYLYCGHIEVSRGLPNDYTLFYPCQGRAYGTWIDDHTASGYVSTDLIEDPAGIIESILIDELGLTTSDIDMDSFDAAENSSVAARINIHNENAATSDSIIRQIAEQSTFAFAFTAGGKAKCIPLNVATPTTQLTIPLSWIKNGAISVSKTDYPVVNKLTVNSRYQQEYGETFADSDEYDDATSQGVYGIRTGTVDWENIAGTSATHVAEHLVYATTGLWSNKHNQIDFELLALSGARIELGDWIELESASCDGRLLCFGASWSGKQFCVSKLAQGPYGTKVTAIEL